MMKSILATGAALLLSTGLALAQTTTTPPGSTTTTPGASGQQMSQAQCESVWSKAATGGATSLTQDQARAYVTNFQQADTNSDSRMSREEFMSACQRGQVHDSATTGGGTGTGSTTGGGAGGASSTGSGSSTK
jgi:hypothetical protein